MDAAEGVHKLKVDAEVRNQILEDLYKWEEEMRERDANYRNTKQDQLNAMRDLPPIRGSSTLQLNGHLPEQKTKAEAVKKEPVLSPVARKQKSEEEKEKGNDFYKKGKFEEALSAYARALEADETNIACYSNRALILNKLQRYKEAEQDCTLALRLDPNYVKALHRRGVARTHLKQFENAKEDFQKANVLEPDNQTVISELKAVENELAKIEEKKKSEKVESAPQERSNNKGVDPTKREEVFLVEELQKLNGTQDEKDKTPVEWKEEGNRLYEKGDVATAIECYTNAINLDPSEAIYTSNRGMAYLSLGRNEEAENDCTNAINLNPRHTKSYQRRGVARLNLGKLEEALSDFQDVRRLDPKNKLVTSQIADVEKLLKERKLKEEAETKIKERLKPVPVRPVSSTRDEKKLVDEFYSRFKVSSDISSKKAPDSVPVTPSSPPSVASSVISPAAAVMTPSTGEKVSSSHLYSTVMPVPPVPKNYAQFWLDWKKMKNNEDAKYRYLKQLRSSDIAAIFRESLEPEDLSEILSVLASSFVPKKDPVLPFLSVLQKVKRFKSAAMFLSNQEYLCLNLLFNAAIENNEDSLSAIDAVRSAWFFSC